MLLGAGLPILGLLGTALASSRRLVGSGWPTVTSLATSASRRVEDRAAPHNRSKAVWRPAVRGHQHPLGLLDQPAMLQGGLQLAGQPPLDLGGDGGAEQAGHQPAWACRAETSLGSQSRGWPA